MAVIKKYPVIKKQRLQTFLATLIIIAFTSAVPTYGYQWSAGACTNPPSPTGCYGDCSLFFPQYNGIYVWWGPTPIWNGGEYGWHRISYRYHEPYARWRYQYPYPRT